MRIVVGWRRVHAGTHLFMKVGMGEKTRDEVEDAMYPLNMNIGPSFFIAVRMAPIVDYTFPMSNFMRLLLEGGGRTLEPGPEAFIMRL